ncbi:MAG TPA: tetratricopeptide repeat protein [Phycisphaerae bacterium]|nr:tetratricopeptide repeat protein [Phycisphaerae bacterium]
MVKRQTAHPPTRWRAARPGRTAAGFLLLLVLGFTLYGGTLDNEFVSDDHLIVAQSATITNPSLRGLVKLWATDYWSQIDETGRVLSASSDRNLYRPVTIFSLWLNALLGPVRPGTFRVVNIFLHVAAAGMVGLWVRRWVGRTGGMVAALVVLFHPVATAVVNRIVGRADTLVLLAVAGFLATQRGAQQAGWSWRRVAVAGLWAFVALGAKESGLVLVPLAALQWWIGRSGPAPEPADRARPARTANRVPSARSWRGALALGVPLVAYLAARLLVVGVPAYRSDPMWDLMGNPALGLPLADRIPIFFSLAGHYLRMLVLPHPLLLFDVPASVPAWGDWQVWAGLAAGAAAAGVTLVLLVRRSTMALIGVWWTANLLIVGQLLAPIGTYTEVRLVYPFLGSIGLAAGVFTAWFARRRRAWQYLAAGAGAAVLIVASCAIVRRNAQFGDALALSQADADARPANPAALMQLGVAYLEGGRFDRAEAPLARATELAPWSAQAWHNLGNCLAMPGRDKDRAEQCYAKALEICPADYEALTNWGVLKMNAGDFAEARRLLTRAEKTGPAMDKVQFNLAIVDAEQGQLDDAIRRLEGIHARRPRLAPVRDKLDEYRRRRGAQQRTRTRPSP